MTDQESLDRISELSQQCLDEKWYRGAEGNISTECPFCEDASKRMGYGNIYRCNVCLCPPAICIGGDGMGLVQIFEEVYGINASLDEISDEDLAALRDEFQKHIINGEKDDEIPRR